MGCQVRGEGVGVELNSEDLGCGGGFPMPSSPTVSKWGHRLCPSYNISLEKAPFTLTMNM